MADRAEKGDSKCLPASGEAAGPRFASTEWFDVVLLHSLKPPAHLYYNHANSCSFGKELPVVVAAPAPSGRNRGHRVLQATMGACNRQPPAPTDERPGRKRPAEHADHTKPFTRKPLFRVIPRDLRASSSLRESKAPEMDASLSRATPKSSMVAHLG